MFDTSRSVGFKIRKKRKENKIKEIDFQTKAVVGCLIHRVALDLGFERINSIIV